jgi:hypothetical protein
MNPTSVETSGLTATFVEETRPHKWIYKLSQAVTRFEHTFDHLVLSWGRDGDTCVFPATPEGEIVDFVGFGFGLGPPYWLLDFEMQAYVDACIEEHLAGDDGLKVCPADWGEGL